MSDSPDHAQVRLAPPILIALCLLAGWCLDQGQVWPVLPATAGVGLRVALSGAPILLGLGLILYCAQLFKRAQTHIEPWRPTSSVITSGPYRYSRNPIYVGFVVAGAGIALAFDSYWMLLGVLVFVLLANKHVIEREEEYLARKFGEAYSSYRRATRRWL
ncbi:MAG: isoprenylcysteine carboxylmethyltransferase family protein [Deltaproteobacteria bacterium]|jgi:protein-S-isoprenylcysteine O-methyltransferase Ste14|nr:isoprenylcysteine carboxylmethyltransferase family protein [Deltaproteobacteria bacterium]